MEKGLIYILAILFSIVFIFLGLDADSSIKIHTKEQSEMLNKSDQYTKDIDVTSEQENKENYTDYMCLAFGIICIIGSALGFITGNFFAGIIFGIIGILLLF